MRMIWKKLSLLLIVFFAVVPVVGQVSLEVVDTEVDGYPVSIWVPVVLSSPTDEIGGIQFDLSLDPAWISMTGITSGGAGYSGDFTGDFNALDDATTRVVFYNSTNNNTIPTGTDTVMWLEYTGTSVLSAVIDMSISNIIISDGTGNVVTSSGSAGGIQIGEVASFSFTDGEADVLDTVSLDLNLTNDGPVGGFQLDVFDTPDNLDFLSANNHCKNCTVLLSNIQKWQAEPEFWFMIQTTWILLLEPELLSQLILSFTIMLLKDT